MPQALSAKDCNPLPTMQDVILDVAKQRNDDVARSIKLVLAFVSDLPSADWEYHELCHSRVIKIPKYVDLPTGSVYKHTLKQVIKFMRC